MRKHSNRFIVITNKHASALQTERGESRLETQVLQPLHRFGKKIVELVMPSPDDITDTVQEGDTIVSCGGDGTANWLVNTLHLQKMNEFVTVVPQPFGGANDIAEGLYGRMRLERIIEQGTPSTAYAITATIETLNDAHTQTVHALGYIGIGASGVAAAAINADRDHMHKKDVISRAAKAVVQSKPFYYTRPAQQPQRGFEWLALNGRMSYVIQPQHNFYFENSHQQILTGGKAEAFAKIGLSIGRLVRGEILTADQAARLQPLQSVTLQADGEAYPVEPWSTVTIQNGPAITIARL